jgi:hypothetical protein
MRQKESAADDDWGRDPAVQGMRRVFAMMEETQREILAALGMPPLDRRLRVWRENTLRLFEETWGKAARGGSSLAEQQVADLYGACFVHVLGKAGISVPPSALPSNGRADGEFARLTKELLK